MSYYGLDGEPIDEERWKELFNEHHRMLHVDVGVISIDTLYVGHPGDVYTTQVSYGSGNVDYSEEWLTREEALAGHEQLVALIRDPEAPNPAPNAWGPHPEGTYWATVRVEVQVENAEEAGEVWKAFEAFQFFVAGRVVTVETIEPFEPRIEG